MRTRHCPKRAGFTLVELLVVISLIAILLALSAGAFFRIQSSQNVSVAEATLQKLHSLMDSKWKITLDDARKTVPKDTATLALYGNDADRVQVAWTYAKLKNEMPMTFAEVVRSFDPMTGKPNLVATTISPTASTSFVKSAFAKYITTANFDPANPFNYSLSPPYKYIPLEVQSAALFYTAVLETASGGTMNTNEGLNQQIRTDPNYNLTYFVDAWGKPVSFVRHAYNAETNGDIIDPSGFKFMRPSQGKGYSPATLIRSSLDTVGKLTTIDANPWFAPSYSSSGNKAVTDFLTNSALPGSLNYGLPLAYQIDFSNVNRLPTLVSSGPNTDFIDPDSAQPDKSKINIADPFATGSANDDTLDNLLSYRLRAVGARN